MGSNLYGFEVKIEFAPDGTVEQVKYWDQEGCGREDVVPMDTTVGGMVMHHLQHYSKSHEMKPPKLCGETVVARGTRYMCYKEPHPSDDNHNFTKKGRS